MSKEPQRLRKYPQLQLPERLHIGYRDYILEEMPDEGKATHVGFHQGQMQSIEINTEMPPVEVVNTLLHEIVHAIFDYANYSFAEGANEEDCTICLGNGLTQFIKDNPDVIDWMQKHLDAKQL
jgi:hypothetical protein